MQQANLITASMLYNHLACPHRVAMDAFGDWNRRDKVSPFVEMLWARGNKYEATVIGGLGPSRSRPVDAHGRREGSGNTGGDRAR